VLPFHKTAHFFVASKLLLFQISGRETLRTYRCWTLRTYICRSERTLRT